MSNSSKHTLGPWKYESGTGFIVGRRDDGSEAEVCYTEWLYYNEPDTLLIEAAPDMLAALVSIRDSKDTPRAQREIAIKAVCAATGMDFIESMVMDDGRIGQRIWEAK